MTFDAQNQLIKRNPPDERGAAVVEAAIVSLVVFFLIFMIVQGALFARTYLAARDAASTGARAGAIGADSPDSDYDVLQAINKSISSTSRSNVETIVVFNPQGTSFSMPPGCTTAGINGMCNHYTAADLARPVSDFEPGAAFTGDDQWPSSGRSTSIGGGLARLGVYVELRVGGIASPLPQTVSESAITQLEPHS